MNVQIHPAHFHKIVSLEPFSLMIDVAAEHCYSTHLRYASLAIARATNLPVAAVSRMVEQEIIRRSIINQTRVRTGGWA